MATGQEPAKALAKASDLISALAHVQEIGPAQLAQRTGIPRSTVYRLLEGLADVGLVTELPDGSSRLSLNWLTLAERAYDGMTEWQGAHDVLEQLTDETGETAFLSVLSGNDNVCIDWARGRGIDALVLRPGRTLPLHAGAAGRAALAALPDEEIDKYLEKAPFEPYNDRTLVTASALRADVVETRKNGYVLSDEDVTIGIGAVGIPLLAADSGRVIGSLSLGGFADDIRKSQLALTEALRLSAKNLPQVS